MKKIDNGNAFVLDLLPKIMQSTEIFILRNFIIKYMN